MDKKTVGSGETTIVRFYMNMEKRQKYSETLKISVATGSATALSGNLATKNEVNLLLKEI